MASAHDASSGSGRIGIGDLARLAGSPGTAWQALRVLSHLRERHPSDNALRLVEASAWVTLGYRTPARETLDEVPRESREANFDALRIAADRLPSDLIDISITRSAAEGAIASLEARGTVSASHARTLRTLCESSTLHRSSRGGPGGAPTISRLPGAVPARWGPLVDVSGQTLEAIRSHPSFRGQWVGPLALLCPPPTNLLVAMHAETASLPDTYSPRIDVVFESANDLARCLPDPALLRIWSDPRVSVIVGDEGLCEWACALGNGALARVPAGFFDAGGGGQAFRTRAIAALRDASSRAGERAGRAVKGLRSAEPTERASVGGSMRGPGASGDDGLRVMVVSSRFSTYVKHAAEDVCEALKARGATAYLMLEPTCHDLYSAEDRLRIAHDFAPDFIVIINHFRANFSAELPESIPVVTLIQDSMPQTLSPDQTGSPGRYDIVAGHVTKNVEEWIGDEGRLIPSPVTASAAKFARARTAPRGERACDIAFITNHSQPPEAMLDQFLSAARDAEAHSRLRRLSEACAHAASSAHSERPRLALWRAVAEVFGDGYEPGGAAHERVLRLVALPLADRYIRHETIRWAARIARDRGLTLGLFGHGWESHPEFGTYARGHVEHRELPGLYASCLCSVHASINWLFHQRIMECALAGGLTLCRWTMDDMNNERLGALCEAIRGGARFEGEAEGRATVYCPRGVHPSVDSALSIEREAGQGDASMCWAWTEHLPELLRQHNRQQRLRPSELLGDPLQTCFWDEASFERTLLTIASDDALRERRAARVREVVEARFTTERLVDQVIGAVRRTTRVRPARAA